MAGLDGIEVLARGNNVSFKRVEFTRPSGLTDDDYSLTSSTIYLSLWTSPASSDTPDIKLSTGSGLALDASSSNALQILDITITGGQLTTLLNSQDSAEVFYAWSIALSGGAETDIPDDSYSGKFTVKNVRAFSAV
ncbi:MAG: hypothetical protein AAGD09_03285 [Cyanobacteria bacterium P01_F01_bin.56]